MYDIPTTIEVNGREFPIRCRGDYRMVLDCFACLGDEELSSEEKTLSCLMIFFEDFNEISDVYATDKATLSELVDKMNDFFECGENPLKKTNYKLIDWDKDSQMICSAVNKVAHVEVRSVEYLHWWTFLGYFSEVGESVLSTVVGIRSKIKKGKKLEKHEKEFKATNPHYFIWDSRTTEQKDEDDFIKSLWNSTPENKE